MVADPRGCSANALIINDLWGETKPATFLLTAAELQIKMLFRNAQVAMYHPGESFE